MDLAHWLLVSAAGLLAGGVNAIAGGGTLISFPALLAAGYPSVTANVTSAVGVLPGYLGGSYGYRAELAGQRRRIRRLGAVSGLGAVVGAVLLLISSDALFREIAPFLVLFSCALLIVQPRLARRLEARDRAGAGELSRGVLAIQFASAVYGGYFGAGLGILMLAVLGSTLADDLHRLNALKGLLSLFISIVSAACFALFGPVVWTVAGVMALASFAGGRLGVAVARRFSASVLRFFVIAFGIVVSIALLR